MVLSPPTACEEIQDTSLIDIDSKCDALFGMPEYAADVHSYLKIAEVIFRYMSLLWENNRQIILNASTSTGRNLALELQLVVRQNKRDNRLD